MDLAVLNIPAISELDWSTHLQDEAALQKLHTITLSSTIRLLTLEQNVTSEPGNDTAPCHQLWCSMSSIQDFVRLNIYKLNHFALYHLKTKMTKEKKTLIDTDGTLFQRNKRRQRLVFCRYCGCSKRTDVLEKHCRAIH